MSHSFSYQLDFILLPVEIGDISVFIREDLTGAVGMKVYLDMRDSIDAKEILPSPSGSMVYFDTDISKVFSTGCAYMAKVFKTMSL